MNNIELKINRKTRALNKEQIFIGMDGENLQENVIFSFEDEFVEGQARLDIEFRDGTKGQITDIQNVGETYVLPIKSEITKYNGCEAQLVITEGTNENQIPIFKSLWVELRVEKSINAETPVPDGYTLWIDTANAKLNQIDEKIDEANQAISEANTLDIDVNKVDKVATIDLTKKDGTTKSVSVHDGYDLDYDWDGTSLGVKREDEQEYEYVDLKGEKGDCNFATFEIIDAHLLMNKPDDLSQIDFRLNSNGHLEMEVSI